MPVLVNPEGRRIMAPDSDLPEKNVGSVFDLIDADRDGYITEDDMPATGRRALDELGITGGPQRAEIMAMYQPIWEQLRADCDSNGDGRITRQEFTEAFAAGSGDPRAYFQRLLGPIVGRMAQAMDRDGDGFIDADEYAGLWAPQGLDEDVIRAGFGRLDADADGKVSTAEFADAIAQMFLSQDPADPGTAVMGHC